MYVLTVLILSRPSIRCMYILFQYGGGYQKDVCAYCPNDEQVSNQMYGHTVSICRRLSKRRVCILFQCDGGHQ